MKKAKTSEQNIIRAVLILVCLIILIIIIYITLNLIIKIENPEYSNKTFKDNLKKIFNFSNEKISVENGYCGDGICEDKESGECYLDCEWCGNGFCEKKEDCGSCSKDCGNCGSDNYCGDGICNKGECLHGCIRDCRTSECIDGVCEPKLNENCLNSASDCRCKDGEFCDNGKCVGIWCGNGICDNNENCFSCSQDCLCGEYEMCLNASCKTYCGNGICEVIETKSSCHQDCGNEEYVDSGVDPNTNYPVIFVHGHSTYVSDSTFSVSGFNEFQQKLDLDNLYRNMGIILPNSNINNFLAGEWGRYEKPVSIRTTYYIGNLDSSGIFIRGDEATRSITEYGQRLARVVDIVLHHTGKNKVILVAHSMGGLVARAYAKNYGTEKIDKMLLIGVPNHGFYKEDMYDYFITRIFNCAQAHPGQECIDMSPNSDFLNNLNSGDETPGNASYMTIAGNCCEINGKRYDETIRVESVPLEGAINIVINGAKGTQDYTFHANLVSPSNVPLVYNKSIEFLSI